METIKSYFTNVVSDNFKGVTFEYQTISKDGEIKKTFHCFPLEIESNNQDSIFKVWKELHKLFWLTKCQEKGLKQYNNAILSKFRSSVPFAIGFYGADWNKVVNIVTSAWKNVGLCPSKKDYDRISESTEKELKRVLHNAAVASFNVLGFRLEFEK